MTHLVGWGKEEKGWKWKEKEKEGKRGRGDPRQEIGAPTFRSSNTKICCWFLNLNLLLAVSASLSPPSGTYFLLTFTLVRVRHRTPSVIFLKPTISIRPSVPQVATSPWWLTQNASYWSLAATVHWICMLTYLLASAPL